MEVGRIERVRTYLPTVGVRLPCVFGTIYKSVDIFFGKKIIISFLALGFHRSTVDQHVSVR